MCFLCVFVYKKNSKTSKKKFSFRIMIPSFKKFRDRASITSLASMETRLLGSPSQSNDNLLINNKNEYNENSSSIVNFEQFDQMLTNTLFDTTIDRFSLLNIKSNTELHESDSNRTLKAFNDEIQTFRHIDSDIDIANESGVINVPLSSEEVIITKSSNKNSSVATDDVYKNLTIIQRDIMPIWRDIDLNERNAISAILKRWEGIIQTNFDRIRNKQKSMADLNFNEKKYRGKGRYNFELNRTQMKKMQLDLFKTLTGGTINDKKQANSAVKPNTRLILRAFKKFDDTFNCLETSAKYEQDERNAPLYWSNLKMFLQHTSKAILRCALYVYQNAHLNKCSLGSPPLYVIESDYFCHEENVPYVKFETLYQYVYLCLSQLDTANKGDRRKNGHKVKEVDSELLVEVKEKCLNSMNKKKTISNYYVLMLNCLIRLIQVATFVRQCLTMKQREYTIDMYSHAVEHECRLFREYLKEVLKIEDQ